MTDTRPAAEARHTVTVEFEPGYGQRTTLRCHADADALCHAVYDCQCVEWYGSGTEDGRPFHCAGEDETERHYGRFEPYYCNIREWFENSDDPMGGDITFAVTATWAGDHYDFEPAALAARPAPVVSTADVEKAIDAVLATPADPMGDPRETARRDVLAVARALGITVADAPAVDDEGGQER